MQSNELVWSTYVENGKNVAATADQLGLSRSAVYAETRLVERGWDTRLDYLDDLAVQKGYASHADYVADLKEQHLDSPQYQAFSAFLCNQLQRRGQKQAWVARATGISRQSISAYCKGFAIPGDENLERILTLLKIQESTVARILRAA